MTKKSLTKQTLSGVIWVGLEKFIKAAMQLLVMGVLARLLDATEFGLMGLALMVTSFSGIFSDMGFGPAITQKEELTKTDVHTGFTYSLVFGGILVIIVWLLSPFIAGFFDNEELVPILKAVAFVLLFNAAYTTPLGMMYRNMEFKKLSLIRTFTYFVGYGGTAILLAYLGYGVWALVIAVLVQSIISMLIYLYFNREHIGISFNKNSFKALIHFGGGYSLSKIFSYFSNQGDKIVVGRILGVEALGLYERGYQLTRYSVSTLGEVIDKVMFSPFSRKQNDRKLIGRIYLDMTYVFSIIFFPLGAFLYTNAKPLVRFVLGENWDDSIVIVQVLSGIVFFLITTRIGSTIAKSLGDVYRRAWRTLFIGTLIVISVYYGSKWGVVGAATAVVICKVIDYILAFSQVKLLTKVKIVNFIETHLLGIGLMLIYYIVYNLVKKALLIHNLSNLIQVLVGGVLLLLVYTLGYLLDYRRVLKNKIKIK